MMTQIFNTQNDLVKDLRKIRDQISSEIKDMSFDEERAYLDKLIADREKPASDKTIAADGLEPGAIG